MKIHWLALFGTFIFLPDLCAGQLPAPSPPPESTTAPRASTQDSSNKPGRTLPAFLILGTVFNERNYAFPGVEVKIRRKGEKKFRYDLYTNSRGEFAVRVPDGIEYEVVVRQKNYKEQSQEVLANLADVQRRLTFKLEFVAPPKAGASR